MPALPLQSIAGNGFPLVGGCLIFAGIKGL
jgi:hypothetical protein